MSAGAVWFGVWAFPHEPDQVIPVIERQIVDQCPEMFEEGTA